MRNNFVCIIVAALSLFGFMACQPDVDVMSGCDKITVNSILGEHSMSMVDGLNFTVAEYKFFEEGKGLFVERMFGNALKTSEKKYNFVYSLEEYGEYNVGRVIRVDAADNGMSELLWKDGVIFNEKQQLYEAKALEENFEKVLKELPNTTWAYHEATLWIDTTVMDSLHYYEKNVRDTIKDPATGKPLVNSGGKDSIVIVKKEFVDTVYYEVYDTVGNKTVLDVQLVLNKDANNANVGSYLYDYKEYNYDLTLSGDSIVDRKFHWGFSSVTSAKKFVVAAVDDAKKDTVAFEISKFDKKKKVLTLEDRELKLQ